MFEQASRDKFRFETPVGLLTTEDLWDLPLVSMHRVNLDDIARGLHRQLRNDDNVSFVNPENKSDATIQAKFDIVKYIIDWRIKKRDEEQVRQDNAARKQRLLAIINEKEDEGLRSKSVEELRAAVEAL